ncbi:MAG: phosphoglycerate kinase [Patescibacteria group bacterium]
MKKISYIDNADIKNKRILLRADFDVSLTHQNEIADDVRIRSNIPTIKQLLAGNNRIICVAKLGRPVKPDPTRSLAIVVKRLQDYLPNTKIRLIKDFLKESQATFAHQKLNEIFVLENIRFYPDEKLNTLEFAQKLALLADVYVNDAFAMSHRTEASVVSVPLILPSYGGLLLKSEVQALDKAIKRPKRPLVAIIGGSKISTKISLINKLIEKADYVILGGGLANVFFRAQRYSIAKSICEYEMVLKARQLLYLAAQKQTAIILPTDVLVGKPQDTTKADKITQVGEKIPSDLSILDIGPNSKALIGTIIAKANTIIWNGPVGLFENPSYRQGTDFIYHTITHNKQAVSIIGGGDTLTAIADKKDLNKITHLSTGGGAMLEFIEKGTLPGLEALKR